MSGTTGLSVLIPIYNYDVTTLVDSLLRQAPDWPGELEILLLDDASDHDYQLTNRPLAQRAGVRYQELPSNVGRAAIRNQLAEWARQPWLLLLDNTGQLPDSQFLARYAAALGQAPVLAGGVCYAALPPADPTRQLRWRYGRHRETRSLAQRRAMPYEQLLVNNLLLKRDVLREFPLDERLQGYGHEDTKLGWELAQAGLAVHHLDNPVRHEGLESAAAFLEKSRQAVRNLAQVLRTEGLGAETRLVQAATRLHRARLATVARLGLAALEPALRRNLLSARPNLRALDMLKLLWLLQEPG